VAGAALLLTAPLLAAPSRAACTGDCDGNLVVTVSEVITAVNIALGQSAVADCPAIDRNASGTVTIDELLAAVNALLSGCQKEPSATATRTVATDTPTPTSTVTPTTTATPTATSTVTPIATDRRPRPPRRPPPPRRLPPPPSNVLPVLDGVDLLHLS
jgi:hypothetical protein